MRSRNPLNEPTVLCPQFRLPISSRLPQMSPFWGDLLPSSLYPPQKGIDLASNDPDGPIGGSWDQIRALKEPLGCPKGPFEPETSPAEGPRSAVDFWKQFRFLKNFGIFEDFFFLKNNLDFWKHFVFFYFWKTFVFLFFYFWKTFVFFYFHFQHLSLHIHFRAFQPSYTFLSI